MRKKLSRKLAPNSLTNSLQHELTDKLLMRQLVNGERKALEILYDRYFQKLCRFCASVYGIAHPEDLVQDVFISIIEKPQSYQEKYAFSTFIYALASNRCKKEWRKQQPVVLDAAPLMAQHAFTFQQHSNLDAKTLQLKIQQWFEMLQTKDKMLFLLRFEHELKLEDIAQILQIPLGSVKSGIFQLLRKLSALLFNPTSNS